MKKFSFIYNSGCSRITNSKNFHLSNCFEIACIIFLSHFHRWDSAVKSDNSNEKNIQLRDMMIFYDCHKSSHFLLLVIIITSIWQLLFSSSSNCSIGSCIACTNTLHHHKHLNLMRKRIKNERWKIKDIWYCRMHKRNQN